MYNKDRGDDEDLYLKPKNFRNRKSKPKVDVLEKSHPVHAPYKRDHANLLLEDEAGDWVSWEDPSMWDVDEGEDE